MKRLNNPEFIAISPFLQSPRYDFYGDNLKFIYESQDSNWRWQIILQMLKFFMGEITTNEKNKKS